MSQINTNAILDASGGTTTSINGYTPTASNMAGRNRIINGDMRIDQRNAGASVTPAQDNFIAARFNVQQNAGAVAPPAGFANYLGVTSTGAYSVAAGDVISMVQVIEGYNSSDLSWGTASASTITMSFWVRSSLTGTFGGALKNASASYSYPFTYTISAANTWEQKSITITGATASTWASNNAASIEVYFSMGTGSTFNGTAGAWAGSDFRSATGATSVVGTSGATFYITGVQLEAGSVATPFEHRQYGQELALCQRYYQKWQNSETGTSDSVGTGTIWTAANFFCVLQYFVPMRALPDGEKSSTTALTLFYNSASKQTTNIVFASYSRNSVEVVGTSTGMGAGQAGFVRFTGASDYLALTAEL